MKRVLTFLAIMLLPLSVMAMTPVSDSTLSDVTGQAGVNINADLTMDIAIGTMAWGDSDGIKGWDGSALNSPWATITSGGYIGMTNFNITNLRIKARETDSYGADGEFIDGNGNPVYYHAYDSTTGIKPITIDVATGSKAGVADVTFVRFGFGALQITMDSMSLGIMLGTDAATLASTGQMMGTVNIGPMEVYINPMSYVDIYAHAGCGVNIEMGIVIDEFKLGYVSWGDTDGLVNGNPGVTGGVGNWISATNAAGYVGLADLKIGAPIVINGTIAIDVVSVATGGGVYAGEGLNTILQNATGALTVVHISFPTNFNVNVGPITGVVTLADVKSLDGSGAGILGDIYLSGFGLTIKQNSWVDIWAH